MENKLSELKSTLKTKRFIITAVVAALAVISSVAVSYYTTDRMKQSLPSYTAPTLQYTEPAQAEKNDVPDDRELFDAQDEDETEVQSQTQAEAEKETAEATKPIVQTTTEEAKLVNAEFILPCDGEVIKGFSMTAIQYSKTMSDWRIHTGVDFAADDGEEVYSVGNGKVSRVISDTKLGYIIEVDYGNFTARYCGICQDGAVGIGDTVSMGSVIGKIADIPTEALDGPHLHFEALKDGKNIDPLEALGM